MLFTPAFLSLVAGASAIDIWLNIDSHNCTGTNRIRCQGINPNKCCSISGQGGSPFRSMEFAYIPSSWDIEMRGYVGSQCGQRRLSRASNGATRVCFDKGPFSGAGYGFINRFLAGRDDEESTNECTGMAKPDILAFDNSVQYNITEMEDALLNEMVSLQERPLPGEPLLILQLNS